MMHDANVETGQISTASPGALGVNITPAHMRSAVRPTAAERLMIKLFKSYGLTRWGYAIILSLMILAVIMMAKYSYRAIDRELTESVLSRRAAVSSLAAAVLTEKFDRLIDIGISLASRVRFRELVERGDWIRASEILNAVPADFPFIDRITLNDARGTLMADIPPAPGLRGRNFGYRAWYQAVMRDGQAHISQIYRRTAAPQLHVFVAAVPIRSSTGEKLGILVVQVRSDTFFEWIKDVDAGPGGLIYVVDPRGVLASHPKYVLHDDLIDYSSVPWYTGTCRQAMESRSNSIRSNARHVLLPMHRWQDTDGELCWRSPSPPRLRQETNS